MLPQTATAIGIAIALPSFPKPPSEQEVALDGRTNRQTGRDSVRRKREMPLRGGECE